MYEKPQSRCWIKWYANELRSPTTGRCHRSRQIASTPCMTLICFSSPSTVNASRLISVDQNCTIHAKYMLTILHTVCIEILILTCHVRSFSILSTPIVLSIVFWSPRIAVLAKSCVKWPVVVSDLPWRYPTIVCSKQAESVAETWPVEFLTAECSHDYKIVVCVICIIYKKSKDL